MTYIKTRKKRVTSPFSICRRGAAMVMAVMCLGIVAAILATMLTFTANDFARSGREAIGSQVDQYHLAAIVIARDALARDAASDGPMQLPAPAIGKLVWEKTGTDTRTAIATIALGETRSARRLTFTRATGTWTLTAVDAIAE